MRALTVAWGPEPENEAPVADPGELDVVLQRLHAEGLARGLARRVSIRLAAWAPGDGSPDPYIGALVGHPERGMVLLREGDESWGAVDPALPVLPRPIPCEHAGFDSEEGPASTRLSPETTRRVLLDYQRTGLRSPVVEWAPGMDPRGISSRTEYVSIDREREMRERAALSADVFRSAGLPVSDRPGAEYVPGVEIEVWIQADVGGVYAQWHEGADLNRTSVDAFAAHRFDDPAIKHAGAVSEAMCAAMLAILESAGFSARMADEDLLPYAVEILAAF